MFAFSIGGILAFLNSAIFLVGYISNNTLFPEPLSSEYTYRKKSKTRCSCM